MNGSDYCYLHNPKISTVEKKQAQSRGGQMRRAKVSASLPELEVDKVGGVVSLLSDTIQRVRSGELDVRVANCLGVLSGQMLKAIEIKRQQEPDFYKAPDLSALHDRWCEMLGLKSQRGTEKETVSSYIINPAEEAISAV